MIPVAVLASVVLIAPSSTCCELLGAAIVNGPVDAPLRYDATSTPFT
jgi:hypothetical protein